MKQVNPHTLELEPIKPKPPIQYVYIVHNEASWDYEESDDVDVFSNFDTSVKEFNEQVKRAKECLRGYCEEEDIIESEDLNTSEQRASYAGYREDDYDAIHCNIWLERKELK